VLDATPHVEQIRATDQVLESADSELGHQLTCFLRNEEEIVDHMLGLAGELPAQRGVLRRDAHRAGVQMALAHHDATLDHQRRGGKAELVRPEQRADHHVATGLHLPVDLDGDAAAQPVQHERLLRLGETELPRRARVLDRRLRRCPCAPVVAGDGHVIGLGLGHARGNRTHPDLGHQFHRDRRARIRVLEVVDQLGEVFDRVDVVVRRRRDEADPRNRKPDLRNVFGNLVTGQLPTLAGLRALRHLDLQLIGVDQVLGGHPEARRCDLLDLGAQRIAFLQRNVGDDAVDA
jgi:hypothetical protein